LRFERAWIEVEVKSGCEAPHFRTLRNGYDREEAEPVDETSINSRIDEQHSRVPLGDEGIFSVQPEFSHALESHDWFDLWASIIAPSQSSSRGGPGSALRGLCAPGEPRTHAAARPRLWDHSGGRR